MQGDQQTNFLTKFFNGTKWTAQALEYTALEYPIKLANLLKALLVIVIIIFVLYIVFYLIYYYHPQIFFICHWTGFETYMTKYYADFRSHTNTLDSCSMSGQIKNAYKTLVGYDIMTELAEVQSLLTGINAINDDELKHIFRFWNSLKNIKGVLQKMDLALIGDDKYLVDGELDPEKSEIKDLASKSEKMRKFRDKIGKLKETIDKKENANTDSGIIGSLDPIKLYWTLLMIDDNYSKDATLKAIHDRMSTVNMNDNVWAMHIKQPPLCKTNIDNNSYYKDKYDHAWPYDGPKPSFEEYMDTVLTSRPLSNNERIYLEIKKFLFNCGNKENVKTFINSVLIIGEPGVVPSLRPEAYTEIRAVLDTIMAVYELDLMLNYYLYDIRIGYETRKSGYRFNVVIWTYFWWPYAQWLFVIKIGKQTWGKFPKNFTNAVFSFLEWWVSLPEALAKLPMTLAGEGFQQPKDSNYPFYNYINNITEPFIPKHIASQMKPDLVEHFGFLKGLLSIGTFFMAILDVAMALVFMITEPLKFIMMLIGFVVALALMVVYILLTVFGLHYVFGGIWAVWTVLMAALFFTIVYTCMILPMSLFYLILWVLDMALGGLVMALMRCENIPDKWYKYSAYAYNNFFQRSITCAYRCADRYEPDNFFVFSLCKRVESIKPTFCPHQNLFKIYKGENLTHPVSFKDFEVNLTTANMTESERARYLEKVFKVRTDYNDACRDCFSNDVKYNDSNELQQKGHDYTHIARIMCKFAAQLSGQKNYEHVCDLCNTLYANDVPIHKDYKYTLNGTGDAETEMFKDKTVDDPTQDPYIKGLAMFTACIIAIALIVYIFKSYGRFVFNKS